MRPLAAYRHAKPWLWLGLVVATPFGLVARHSPNAVAPPLSRGAVDCLALNIYHEARGEPMLGQLAVGHVVLNRLEDSRFPSDVCQIVRQGGEERGRCQFSWWCDGRSDVPADARAWASARSLARQMLAGRTQDPTRGALWYHAVHVAPSWRTAYQHGPHIGAHVFYLQPQADEY